jgi:hypothetical protein
MAGLKRNMKSFWGLFWFLTVFYFQLIINTANAQSLKRGPYLQIVGTSSVTVRWETNESGIGKVGFGEKFGLYDRELKENNPQNSHIFTIDKLKPDTRYYYFLELDGKPIVGDSSNFFHTAPEINTKRKLHFVAFGDCGTQQPEQVEVAKAIQNYFKGKLIDGMLLLGDNAYNYGYESEYQSKFFEVYDKFFLKNTALWTSPGNHDYGDNRTWEKDHNGVKPAYFSLFTIPTKAEAGGVPSENQAYYSYNYGNVHFVSLDSYGLNDGKLMADTTSKLTDWLRKDLAENKSLWTVIFFHHPPFTKGSHNSDTEEELINIRKQFVKLIDQFEVDLVLNGHSHNYERSFPVSGFYGTSDEFELSKFAFSGSNGKYDGSANSCLYVKEKKGTVYVVSGSSGWVGGSSPGYPHKAMVYSNSEITGATVFEIEDNRMDLKFISNKGVVLDKFSMIKKIRNSSELEIDCGEKIEIKPSWVGDFHLEGVKASGLVVDSLTKDINFKMKDQQSCVNEDIRIKVKPLEKPVAGSNSPVYQGQTLILSAKGAEKSTISWNGPALPNTPGNEVKIPNVSMSHSGTFIATSQFKYCLAYDSVKVQILQPLSIGDEKLMQIFPNPVTNGLEIKSDENISRAFVIDPTGRTTEVILLKVNQGHYHIDLEKVFFNAVPYLLELDFANGQRRQTRFFIK